MGIVVRLAERIKSNRKVFQRSSSGGFFYVPLCNNNEKQWGNAIKGGRNHVNLGHQRRSVVRKGGLSVGLCLHTRRKRGRKCMHIREK